MVHNGIEYGMMAAYAEGPNILKHADIGLRRREKDAETTPLRDPEAYRYQINVGQVAEVWRRGSVVASWLLDLTAGALVQEFGAHGVFWTSVGLGRGTLDDAGRGRRGCASPGDQRGALRTV